MSYTGSPRAHIRRQFLCYFFAFVIIQRHICRKPMQRTTWTCLYIMCSVVKALQAYIERFERGSERYCCLRCAHTKWILPRPPSIWAPSKKSLDSKKSSVSSLNLNQFCQSPSQVESGQSKLQHAQTQAHAQLHCDWLEVRTEPYLTQVLLFDSCTRRSYQSKKL